jgi:hypothetical protein
MTLEKQVIFLQHKEQDALKTTMTHIVPVKVNLGSVK